MIALLAMAFGAGLISPVNPCGFALLPALLGTVADPGERSNGRTSVAARLGAGLGSGLVIAAGFAGILTVAGLALAAGLRAVTGLAPWFAVAVGVLLAVAGLAMLTGWQLPLRLTTRAQPRRRGGRWGLFAFGVGYGIASLSCTVAVLLAVVSQAAATTNLAGMLAVFAAYAAGAATLLLLLSVSAAFASTLATRWVRRLLPHMHRITAVLLILSGAYLLAYWIPVTTGAGPPAALSLGAFAGTVATWISTHQTLVVILALAAVLLAAITTLFVKDRAMTTDPPPLADQLATTLSPTLTEGAQSWLWHPLLRLLAHGEPVTIEQLAAATGHSSSEIRHALTGLPDTEYDEHGRIVGHGLTLRPTPHRFTLDGQQLYTWCALDTLLFPALLGRPATVESPCHATGTPVRVQVEPDTLAGVEPASAVVSLVTPQQCTSVRSAFCNKVHFFASPEAAQPWLVDHPDATVRPVAEAFTLGHQLAEQHLTPQDQPGCC